MSNAAVVAVPLATLNRVIAHADAAMKKSKLSSFYAGRGNIRQSQTATREAAEESNHAVLLLQIMGATLPSVRSEEFNEPPPLDTPANRRLLHALREAVRAAEERDKETGDSPDGFAEVLSHFADGVAEEVEGPARTAGRE